MPNFCTETNFWHIPTGIYVHVRNLHASHNQPSYRYQKLNHLKRIYMSYTISKSPKDMLRIDLLLCSINESKFSKNFTTCNEAKGILITELRKMQIMNQKLSSSENELQMEKNNLEHNGSISNTNPAKNKPWYTMWLILQML